MYRHSSIRWARALGFRALGFSIFGLAGHPKQGLTPATIFGGPGAQTQMSKICGLDTREFSTLVIEAREIDGRSYREIAIELGIVHSTFSRIHNLREVSVSNFLIIAQWAREKLKLSWNQLMEEILIESQKI